MSEQPESGVEGIDRVAVAEARAVFGVEEVDFVESLRPRPLGATVGVWRVRAGSSSAVLKLLHPRAGPNPNWAASEDEGHPRWWRREVAVLSGRVLAPLWPELRPPVLLGVFDRPDGTVALWLEDLGAPTTWSVETIASVARELGVAQARAGRELPAGLAAGFLAAYLEPRSARLVEPFASRRSEILCRFEQAPQTLCHFDLHPANVFPSSGGTAVIDWAYCGRGPLGGDAGVLASDALADEIIPANQAIELVAAVWDAYSDGLADTSLSAAAAEVYALGTALRYSWLPAWLAGSWGPPISETRRPGVAAAHDVFQQRALQYL